MLSPYASSFARHFHSSSSSSSSSSHSDSDCDFSDSSEREREGELGLDNAIRVCDVAVMISEGFFWLPPLGTLEGEELLLC